MIEVSKLDAYDAQRERLFLSSRLERDALLVERCCGTAICRDDLRSEMRFHGLSRKVLQKNPGRNGGGGAVDLHADLLATHERGLAHGQPNVANNPAIVPPVVPGFIGLTQAQCPPRNRLR